MDLEIDMKEKFKNMIDNFTKKFNGMNKLSKNINSFITNIIKIIADYNDPKSLINIRLSLEYLITKLKDDRMKNGDNENLSNYIDNMEQLSNSFNNILDNQTDSLLKLRKIIDGITSNKEDSNTILNNISIDLLKKQLSDLIQEKQKLNNNKPNNLTPNRLSNNITLNNTTPIKQSNNVQSGGNRIEYFNNIIKFENLDKILPFYRDQYDKIDESSKPLYMILLKSINILLNTCVNFYNYYSQIYGEDNNIFKDLLNNFKNIDITILNNIELEYKKDEIKEISVFDPIIYISNLLKKYKKDINENNLTETILSNDIKIINYIYTNLQDIITTGPYFKDIYEYNKNIENYNEKFQNIFISLYRQLELLQSIENLKQEPKDFNKYKKEILYQLIEKINYDIFEIFKDIENNITPDSKNKLMSSNDEYILYKIGLLYTNNYTQPIADYFNDQKGGELNPMLEFIHTLLLYYNNKNNDSNNVRMLIDILKDTNINLSNKIDLNKFNINIDKKYNFKNAYDEIYKNINNIAENMKKKLRNINNGIKNTDIIKEYTSNNILNKLTINIDEIKESIKNTIDNIINKENIQLIQKALDIVLYIKSLNNIQECIEITNEIDKIIKVNIDKNKNNLNDGNIDINKKMESIRNLSYLSSLLDYLTIQKDKYILLNSFKENKENLLFELKNYGKINDFMINNIDYQENLKDKYKNDKMRNIMILNTFNKIVSESQNAIRVYVKFRDENIGKISDKYEITDECITINGKTYGKFERVFKSNTSLSDLYYGIGNNFSNKLPITNSVRDITNIKYRANIFLTYGFSGTGKTTLLLGRNIDSNPKNKKGIITNIIKDSLDELYISPLGTNIDTQILIGEVYGDKTTLSIDDNNYTEKLFLWNINNDLTKNDKPTEYNNIDNNIKIKNYYDLVNFNKDSIIQTKDIFNIKENNIYEMITEDKLYYKLEKTIYKKNDIETYGEELSQLLDTKISQIQDIRRRNNRVRCTKYNPDSSRSHMFFIIKIYDPITTEYKYNIFIDKAGNEIPYEIAADELVKITNLDENTKLNDINNNNFSFIENNNKLYKLSETQQIIIDNYKITIIDTNNNIIKKEYSINNKLVIKDLFHSTDDNINTSIMNIFKKAKVKKNINKMVFKKDNNESLTCDDLDIDPWKLITSFYVQRMYYSYLTVSKNNSCSSDNIIKSLDAINDTLKLLFRDNDSDDVLGYNLSNKFNEKNINFKYKFNKVEIFNLIKEDKNIQKIINNNMYSSKLDQLADIYNIFIKYPIKDTFMYKYKSNKDIVLFKYDYDNDNISYELFDYVTSKTLRKEKFNNIFFSNIINNTYNNNNIEYIYNFKQNNDDEKINSIKTNIINLYIRLYIISQLKLNIDIEPFNFIDKTTLEYNNNIYDRIKKLFNENNISQGERDREAADNLIPHYLLNVRQGFWINHSIKHLIRTIMYTSNNKWENDFTLDDQGNESLSKNINLLSYPYKDEKVINNIINNKITFEENYLEKYDINKSIWLKLLYAIQLLGCNRNPYVNKQQIINKNNNSGSLEESIINLQNSYKQQLSLQPLNNSKCVTLLLATSTREDKINGITKTLEFANLLTQITNESCNKNKDLLGGYNNLLSHNNNNLLSHNNNNLLSHNNNDLLGDYNNLLSHNNKDLLGGYNNINENGFVTKSKDIKSNKFKLYKL